MWRKCVATVMGFELSYQTCRRELEGDFIVDINGMIVYNYTCCTYAASLHV